MPLFQLSLLWGDPRLHPSSASAAMVAGTRQIDA
jgi:hypothetical protein